MRSAPAPSEPVRGEHFVGGASPDVRAARLDALERETAKRRRALVLTLEELRPRALSIANGAGGAGPSSTAVADRMPELAHRWSRRAIRRLSGAARARILCRLRDRPIGAALLIGGVAWGACRALLAAPLPAALSGAGAVLLSREAANRSGSARDRRNADRTGSRPPSPARRRGGVRASGRSAPRRTPSTKTPRRTPSRERTE